MLIFGIIVLVIVFVIAGFMRLPRFGRLPSGERLARVLQSPQYKKGKFQNSSPTPDLTNGANYYTVFRDFFLRKDKHATPPAPLPSAKTNLLTLDPADDILVWFGHSSYFFQVDGKRFLVDPVLSGAASPLSFTTRSFAGTDVYSADELPDIDYLIITHDHWDHLDYKTLKALQLRVDKVITGLGVGAHLERWGYAPASIIEKDWNEEIALGEGFTIHTVPARHFSGRGFKRAQSIWSSFVLITPTMKLFLGGDSGYDTHFAAIGHKFGPFDLAVLECGQYNLSWQYIHMLPEEVAQAATDLKAKQLLPVHWGKFLLAPHGWNEPIERVTAAARALNLPVLTPMIGEGVQLKGGNDFAEWWKNIS